MQKGLHCTGGILAIFRRQRPTSQTPLGGPTRGVLPAWQSLKGPPITKQKPGGAHPPTVPGFHPCPPLLFIRLPQEKIR